MIGARLARALETGAPLAAGDGPILVLGAAAGDDLSALPRARLHVVATFRPDHDAFAAAGVRTGTAPEGSYAAALVALPRSRDAARARVARAAAHLAPGGLLAVDGQKTDGIDGLFRAVRGRMAPEGVIARGHGKLFWGRPAPGAFAGWEGRDTALPGGFVTRPGLFSADGPDPGSVLLAAALPQDLAGRIADVGAGWGWLAAAALTRPGVREVHLIEAELEALDCARAAIADPRARFHWADARSFRPERPFDAVVMNPPFHRGRAAAPELGAALIAAAADMLAPQGTLWLVANRQLPYEEVLRRRFREVAEVAGSRAFKVIAAARPAAAAAGRPAARPLAPAARRVLHARR